MAVSALPSQAFADVQRYLKQRRATGQAVSPREERSAWQAYYDSLAANRAQSAAIGARERQLDMEQQRIKIAEEAQENAEAAAKISGLVEIGTTGVLGAMALKDTAIGAKIGLGKPGAAPKLPVGGAAAAPAASAVYPGAGLGPVGTPGAAGMAAGPAVGTSAASPLTAGTAAAAGGAGIAGGMVGSFLGEKVAGDKGAAVGGVMGGAGIGAIFGGAPGAILGGVLGGLTGIVQGKK